VFGRLFGNLFEKVGKAQKVLLPRARTTTAEEGDARVVRRWVVRLYGCFGSSCGGLVMRGYEGAWCRQGKGVWCRQGKGVYEKRREEKSKTPWTKTQGRNMHVVF